MRELVEAVPAWLAEGRRVAVAAVLETWGSAPRRPGALMAVADDGRMAGSVSGGCVEAAVAETALALLAEAEAGDDALAGARVAAVVGAEAGAGVVRSGAGRRLDFDVADADALAVGLACGGRLAVQVAAWPRAAWERLLARAAGRMPIEIVWLAEQGAGRWADAWFVERADGGAGDLGRPATRAVSVVESTQWASATEDPRIAGSRLNDAAVALAAALVEGPADPGPIAIVVDGATFQGHRHVIPPPPRAVLVGGGHLGASVARAVAGLGWEATVIDPRAAFAHPERFPVETRLERAWPAAVLERTPPDAATAVVALSHDPKLDDGALAAALRGPAFYVGALGGRRTAEARRARLAGEGLGPEALDRLRAPIGLDIGAVTPEEIAVAIAAELVAAWRAGPGREARTAGSERGR